MSLVFSSPHLGVNILLGTVALALMVISADQAVKRMIALADYLNLSTTFMGMTVVSVATSIPEISSHLVASVGILTGALDYERSSAIVLGANIGSNVVQQTVILGLAAFLAGSLYFRRYFIIKNLLPLILTALLCFVLALDRYYSRLDGLVLFLAFMIFAYYLYRDERKHYKREETVQEKSDNAPRTRRQAIVTALIGLACMGVTVLSAGVVLQTIEVIVGLTGIAGSLIGVMVLGVASALPELTTAISGIKNREHGISLGTLIGSNIVNPLVGIGAGAMLSTYWAPRPFVLWDLPWQALGGALLWAMIRWRKGRLTKVGALYLFVLYLVYLIGRALLFPTDYYS